MIFNFSRVDLKVKQSKFKFENYSNNFKLQYSNENLYFPDEESFLKRTTSSFVGHQKERHNIISEENHLDEKSTPTVISSRHTTCILEYDNDKTLEIKDEIIQDQNSLTSRKFNKKYVPKFDTADRYILPVKKLRTKLHTKKKPNIQKAKEEPKGYKCENCARTYKQKGPLTFHQKFKCGLMPQFRCKFCNKKFTEKNGVSRHINRVHQKTNAKTSRKRHYCDKCTQSYTLINNLSRHKRFDHAEVKVQFICDYCFYKTTQKAHLSKHIISCHLK